MRRATVSVLSCTRRSRAQLATREYAQGELCIRQPSPGLEPQLACGPAEAKWQAWQAVHSAAIANSLQRFMGSSAAAIDVLPSAGSQASRQQLQPSLAASTHQGQRPLVWPWFTAGMAAGGAVSLLLPSVTARLSATGLDATEAARTAFTAARGRVARAYHAAADRLAMGQAAAAGAWAGLGVRGADVAAVAPPPQLRALGQGFASAIADAAARASAAVVNIEVPGNAACVVGPSASGFVVREDGVILTSAHFVLEALKQQQPRPQQQQQQPQLHPRAGQQSQSQPRYQPRGWGWGDADPLGAASLPGHDRGRGEPLAFRVAMQDGRLHTGRLLALDRVTDLALLKVDTGGTRVAPVGWGSSRGLRAGEWVIALGSPLHLQNSVTAGIVSCCNRKGVELGLAGADTDFIQTDAAINPGNAGGPLLNLAGEVVGVSSMKAVSAPGISFAVPIDTARHVVDQLLEHGRVIRPFLGIKMLELDAARAAQLRAVDPGAVPQGLAGPGILVPSVTRGSPADEAGLRPGDVITGFEGLVPGQPLTASLTRELRGRIGQPLRLTVRRGDSSVEVEVVASEASTLCQPGPPLQQRRWKAPPQVAFPP